MANALTRIMRRLNQNITHGPPQEAVTGKLNSNGTVNQNLKDGLTGPYVWVRLGGSREETRAKVLKTRDDWANVPVIVQRNRRTKELEVMELDPIKGPETLGEAAAAFNVPRRAAEHGDTVAGRNFKPGRLTSTGLTVYFPDDAGFPYEDSAGADKSFPDDVAVDNQRVTLTAPGAGLQQWVKFVFNPDATTPMLTTVLGTTFALSQLAVEADGQHLATPDGYLALDTVLIKYGDTLLPETRWLYTRKMFVSASPAAPSSLPNYGASATKTLASDIAAAGADRNLVIAAETGTADNLIEITGLAVGDSLILRADAGDTITVKHNDAGATDKIFLYGAVDLPVSGNQALILTKVEAGKVVQQVDAGTGATLPYPQRATMWHDESTKVTGTVAVTASVLATQRYCFYALIATEGNGDVWTNGVFLEAGTYTVSLLAVRGTDSGIIDFLFTDSAAATTSWNSVDLYNGVTDVNNVQTSSITVANSGWLKITGTINGKNASSSSYRAQITKMWFKQSAD